MDNTDEISRGRRAKQLVENELFQEAFAAAQDSILHQMDKVPIKDAEMHTRLILAKQMLGAVKQYLEAVINTGEMADISLNQKAKLTNLF